ncbi:MAG: hypothetical protein HYU63_07375, partial [Armatimonadetes bacterium]|nr:hypothetical protein [Armatimonadota bacterium]
MTQIRIGIDVGGTFTHAVAINNQTLNIIASVVTPTTHNAKEGVALGIIKAFQLLLEKIPAESKIIFIAHSTTQATNALLEGDVSAVGILGIGKGMDILRVKGEINLPHLEITKGKFLKTSFEFYNLANNWDENEAQNLILSLKTKGAQSIVTAQAFSVDDPQGEKNALILARNLGFPACGTHEISGLYGLRIRTRTAVINASILPKMNETANLTQNGIQKAQIDAPLMIMRSDGGVMTIEEMRRRPLLTLLSGPAAGIAAALTYIQ